MPYVQQYVMGMDRTFQREISVEQSAELYRAGLEVGSGPFPGIALWDDAAAIEHARETLIRLVPPHFPDPDADPVAVLEARIVELEEINAAQYAEMTAWRAQLEAALEMHASMIDVTAQMVSAGLSVYVDWLDDDAPRRPLDEGNLMETIFRAMIQQPADGVLPSAGCGANAKLDALQNKEPSE